MKKAAVYSPYWDTLGGGEKYVAAAAEVLADLGYATTILWGDPALPLQLKERFGIELSKVQIDEQGARIIQSGSIYQKFAFFRDVDVLFFLSDGSVPLPFAKRTIVHFQVPFTKTSFATKLKLSLSQRVVCNSEFTKKIIDETYSIASDVLYPPSTLLTPGKKEQLILSVGRFAPEPTSKRQDILIKAFRKLNLPGWRLVLAGGSKNGDNVLAELRKMATGLSVEIIPNPSFKELQKLYGQAALYWHAAGFGADLTHHPERAEHFGISTVEAMSAGAVPVVFAGGGQIEIVRDGKDGFLWSTVEELTKRTRTLIEDQKLLNTLKKSAILRSGEFSREKFEHDFKALLG